jgi:hypothetical protein
MEIINVFNNMESTIPDRGITGANTNYAKSGTYWRKIFEETETIALIFQPNVGNVHNLLTTNNSFVFISFFPSNKFSGVTGGRVALPPQPK